MINNLVAKVHASVLAVDIPKPELPEMPDSDQILDKGSDGIEWLSLRSGSFWTIAIILVVAALIAGALKKPLVRGMLIGVVILAVLLAIVNN